MKNNALRKFRLDRDMTQAQIAEAIGVKVQNYVLLEQGRRIGTFEFWIAFQTAFALTDSEVWNIATYLTRNRKAVHDLSEKQAGARCRHI